ncbi:MAG: hypothetical protein JWO95_3545 [Verrucomicrobiales bacterium]|nr:hypothetical protein [Verrucomicrobiales bacterium]
MNITKRPPDTNMLAFVDESAPSVVNPLCVFAPLRSLPAHLHDQPRCFQTINKGCTPNIQKSSVLAGPARKNGKKILLNTFYTQKYSWAHCNACFWVAQSVFRCGSLSQKNSIRFLLLPLLNPDIMKTALFLPHFRLVLQKAQTGRSREPGVPATGLHHNTRKQCQKKLFQWPGMAFNGF